MISTAYLYAKGPTSLKTGVPPVRNSSGLVKLKKKNFITGFTGDLRYTSTINSSLF